LEFLSDERKGGDFACGPTSVEPPSPDRLAPLLGLQRGEEDERRRARVQVFGE
jgi:hypothetical protein